MNIRDSRDAFANAIKSNKLSDNELSHNYAGKYMYMYSSEDSKIDYFKHCDTIEYLKVSVNQESQNYQDYDIYDYVKKFNLTPAEVNSDYWKENPNHQPLFCMEGMIYGVRVK